MKISELTSRLSKIKNRHGDVSTLMSYSKNDAFIQGMVPLRRETGKSGAVYGIAFFGNRAPAKYNTQDAVKIEQLGIKISQLENLIKKAAGQYGDVETYLIDSWGSPSPIKGLELEYPTDDNTGEYDTTKPVKAVSLVWWETDDQKSGAAKGKSLRQEIMSNIRGDVITMTIHLNYKNIKKLTDVFDFSKYTLAGSFFCDGNQLTSLEGAPKAVAGNFSCSENNLTSLKGAPRKVGWQFHCNQNKLTSLEGGPEYVAKGFNCSDNRLTSLKGSPRYVGGDFVCTGNQLTSLDGAPEEIGGDIRYSNNQITGRKKPTGTKVGARVINNRWFEENQSLKENTMNIDPKELEMGTRIEHEHTQDDALARKIATDHLKEDPHYYTKLKKAGLEEEMEEGALTPLEAGMAECGDAVATVVTVDPMGNKAVTQGDVVGAQKPLASSGLGDSGTPKPLTSDKLEAPESKMVGPNKIATSKTPSMPGAPVSADPLDHFGSAMMGLFEGGSKIKKK